MKVFNADLDNTIIYSYRHDIGSDKRNVEMHKNNELSFVTEKTYSLLQCIKDEILFVPTTTRTIEQYNRIDLGIGILKYALVCNGGVLLVNGKEDEEWYKDSLQLVQKSEAEMKKALDFLESEKRRIFDLRFIKDLFIFTKCNKPEAVVSSLREKLNTTLVDVINSGMKVYVVPKDLSKGRAVLRFKEYVQAESVIAAGDSEFDISMLEEADVSIAPQKLAGKHVLHKDIILMPEEKVYSEEVLEYVKAIL